MSGTFESQFICSAQVHFKFFIFLVDFANIIKNLDFFLNNNKSFMNINLVQNTTKTRLLNHVLSNIYYYNLCKRKIHPLILSLVYTKTYEYFMQVRLKSCNYYISSSHILPKIMYFDAVYIACFKMVSYSTEYNLKINLEFECVRATETRFLNKRFPHSSIVMENI